MSSRLEEKKKKLDEQLEKTLIRKKLLLSQEKKKRALKFKEIGKLAYDANIDELDDLVLLGAFLEISKNLTEEKIKEWKKVGESLKHVPKNTGQILCFSFSEEPSKEVKKLLKEKKFLWNRFRKEYCGNGKKEEIELILKGCKFKMEEFNP